MDKSGETNDFKLTCECRVDWCRYSETGCDIRSKLRLYKSKAKTLLIQAILG